MKNIFPDYLLAQSRLESHAASTALARQGNMPRTLYFVKEGELSLQRLSAAGDLLTLQRTRHGLAAEASLLSGRYHCDLVVTQAAEVVALPILQVKNALQEDAAFAFRWIAMLNTEVRRLRTQSQRLALKGVRARLLHLMDTEGKNGKLPIPSGGLKSLASELSVTHEALYRTVANLEQQGIITRGEGFMVLEKIHL